MLLALQIDPVITNLVLVALCVVVVGFIVRMLYQPYVMAYILTGVLIGPHALGLVTNESLITDLGSLGLVLLLFFIGMEISLNNLLAGWRISIVGTLLQVLISVGAMWTLGIWFEWSIQRSILLGFVISLSSSAVIIKLLEDKNETHNVIGKNVIGVLLVQDVLIVPMLVILNYLGGNGPSGDQVILQILGGCIIIGFVIWISHKRYINLPFQGYIRRDRELQVFSAFILCFGFAILSSLFHLSPALGAFVAGLVVSASRSTTWVQGSLHSFRIIFVALFFVSIGLLINLGFLYENILTISLILLTVFCLNNLINGMIFRLMGEAWRDALYSGALLAQVGEFGFVIASTGYFSGIIKDQGYQLAISVISLSLLLSPIWISLVDKLLMRGRELVVSRPD